MKLKIKEYWFFYVLALVIILGIIGIAVLSYYSGNQNTSWWRFDEGERGTGIGGIYALLVVVVAIIVYVVWLAWKGRSNIFILCFLV